MKRTILLLFILTTNFCLSQSNWVNKTTYNVKDQIFFTSVKFFDSNTGYTTGNKAIYKTTDGGVNWLPVPTTFEFDYDPIVYFKDVNTIYAASILNSPFKSKLIKTSNGGSTWEQINIPDSLYIGYKSSIYFPDAQHGYIFERTSGYKTTNGGLTWNNYMYPPNFDPTGYSSPYGFVYTDNAMFIHSGEYDFGGPSTLIRSVNGQDWSTVLNPYDIDGSSILSVKYLNANTGVAITWKPVTINGEVLQKLATDIFTTTDGGVSWSRKQINILYPAGININSSTSIDIPCTNGYVYHSADGGNNFSWTYFNAKFKNIERSVTGNTRFLFGSYNAVYRSPEEAAPFTDISSSNGSHTDLYSISFANSLTGFAVGERGTILKSTDGGENFNRITNLTGINDTVNYHYINFFDETNGILAGNFALRKTIDRGITWTNLTLPERGKEIQKVDFSDIDHGIVRMVPINGEMGKDFYTSNGGLSWKKIAEDFSGHEPHYPETYYYENFKITSEFIYVLQSHFWSAISGYSGDDHMVLSRRLSDTTYTNSIGAGTNCGYGISLIKSKDDQIVNYTYSGQYNRSILNYTSLNANVWNSDSIGVMPEESFGLGNNVYFGLFYGYPNANITSKYWIKKSFNEGHTWYNFDSLISFGPSQIYFVDNNTGFIIGNGGMIIKTTNGGNVGVGNTITSLPDKFILEQNYPNPFNPVTKINFSLPSASKITLKVYDILGREVAALINSELRTAGNYSVSFDGSKYSSGVYFYKLVNDDNAGQSITKRMMLIK